jgi:acetyl-CoA carboxylase biotin carboxyl carrier protein
MNSKIDYDEISKLIDLLDKRDLAEFELEVEGFKIKIIRNAARYTSSHSRRQADAMDGQAAFHDAEAASAAEAADGFHYIKSPMVGTFYRAPDPASPPFVEIGEPVKPAQTVCIIEAMKLMNEIEADIEGVIEEIYVKNGKAVEYGQKLFAVKPLS